MIPVHRGDVPYLTTEQMIEVDRLMIEEYRIDLLQMMENAGRTLAFCARSRFLANDPRGRRVVVLAGSGGNGGGALACARRLHGYGAEIVVAVTGADDTLSPATAHQLYSLRRLGVTPIAAAAVGGIAPVELVIDGVIGYSLSGAPRGAAAALIRWANTSAAPVLALDTPSGLDASSGRHFDPAIRAAATMTLALPKLGLRAEGAAEHVGELYLADIGVPPGLYAEDTLGFEVGPIFARSDLLRLA